MGSPPRLVLRDAARDLVVVASVSGGKDSTALLCALREAEIPHRAVFADTGWEAPETYEYLDTLRRVLGIVIDVVGYPGGFAARALVEGILPHRKTAWCTRELKVKPLRAYHERIAEECDTDTVSAVGIRAEESARRSSMVEWEYSREWGGYVWRPLIRWSVEDVLRAHHRHGVPVNPLYQLGHSRVGCAPCRNANKSDLRVWGEHHPSIIEAVRRLEGAVTAERASRGHAGDATFFVLDRGGPAPIDRVLEWARTDRGGRQLPLLREDPDSGCFRWGICEPPTRDDDE